MAFDLGDPIPLTFITKDATGALASVTTAVLTITLPDATTVTPAVTTVSVGTYAPTTPYLSTLAGIHRVSWVGSGVNAQDFTDTFNVLAADPRFIISLAEARAGLVLSPGQTAKDEDLRTYIAAACPIMEDIVGAILRTPRVETYDGGRPQIALLYSPLISVTTVVESYGSTYERSLTLQNRFDGSPVSAYGFDFDAETGLLTRLVSGVVAAFPKGRRNVQVSYISGRTSVRGNVLLATRRLTAHLWRQDQTWNRPGVPAEEMLTTPSGFAVPRAVIEMCGGADTRTPGVA